MRHAWRLTFDYNNNNNKDYDYDYDGDNCSALLSTSVVNRDFWRGHADSDAEQGRTKEQQQKQDKKSREKENLSYTYTAFPCTIVKLLRWYLSQARFVAFHMETNCVWCHTTLYTRHLLENSNKMCSRYNATLSPPPPLPLILSRAPPRLRPLYPRTLLPRNIHHSSIYPMLNLQRLQLFNNYYCDAFSTIVLRVTSFTFAMFRLHLWFSFIVNKKKSFHKMNCECISLTYRSIWMPWTGVCTFATMTCVRMRNIGFAAYIPISKCTFHIHPFEQSFWHSLFCQQIIIVWHIR